MFKEKYFSKIKERRNKYRGAKRFVISCRNNGSCNYCRDNRTIQYRRQLEKMKTDLIYCLDFINSNF